MKLSSKSKLVLGLVAVITLLVVNKVVSYTSIQRAMAEQTTVADTKNYLLELERLQSTVVDAETSIRGYVITGQDEYLVPYEDAVATLQAYDRTPSVLLSDSQVERVGELFALIDSRMEIGARAIDIRRNEGPEAAAAYIASGVGKAEMDQVRSAMTAIQSTEQVLLNQRMEEAAQANTVALTTVTIGFGITASLILAVYILMARVRTEKEKLDNAYAELKRIEGMRDSLTAMLVHDLRTPLTTMLGSLDLLNEQGDSLPPEVQRDMIGLSTEGGYRLLRLINELLDISKMEAGEMKLRLETVRVDHVIAESMSQVMGVDFGDSKKITSDVTPDLPLIKADHELIIRVLVNLVGNAIKFTPNGGTVTVGARVVTASDNLDLSVNLPPKPVAGKLTDPFVLFFVADTGEGIPKEDLPKIFDKFAQVESRVRGRKASSGLGLTFCRLAVEAHDGTIWGESELGKGSTFFFTVPLRGKAASKLAGQKIGAPAN